jgi:signal transduction histidine kinase
MLRELPLRYTDVLPLLGAGARTQSMRRAVQHWLQAVVTEQGDDARDLHLERERAKCERRDAERLIREVGDELLQDLGAIAYFVAAATHEARREGAPLVEPLDRIGGLLTETMRHCRLAIEDQALFQTQRRGLLPALEHLVEVLNRSGGPRFELIADPAHLDELPIADAHELFRIAEAGLLDAREQRAGTRVIVRVGVDNQELSLEIEEAGEFDATSRRCLAASAMDLASYRARGLGGRIDFCDRRGAGLLLRCEVPLRRRQDSDRRAAPFVFRGSRSLPTTTRSTAVADRPYCPT